MKHFEQCQFLVVWYCDQYYNCDNEREYTKLAALEMAKRVLIKELKKCKERFPSDYMKHTLIGAKVYDELNRWEHYYHLTINSIGEIKINKVLS